MNNLVCREIAFFSDLINPDIGTSRYKIVLRQKTDVLYELFALRCSLIDSDVH